VSGDILGLAQIGFAVSVGILIDTFVVRTVLDPALASFFGRWTWWPGRLAPAAPEPLAASDVEAHGIPQPEAGCAE
jgi:RND superfamily putative drug exporter